MTDFPFHYKGTVTLSNDHAAFDLHNCELWEERGVEENLVGGEVVCTYSGLRSWSGVARAVQVPRSLLDVLGGAARVRLADGRTGKVYVTGYCEESTWVVEITGVGEVPK